MRATPSVAPAPARPSIRLSATTPLPPCADACGHHPPADRGLARAPARAHRSRTSGLGSHAWSGVLRMGRWTRTVLCRWLLGMATYPRRDVWSPRCADRPIAEHHSVVGCGVSGREPESWVPPPRRPSGRACSMNRSATQRSRHAEIRINRWSRGSGCVHQPPSRVAGSRGSAAEQLRRREAARRRHVHAVELDLARSHRSRRRHAPPLGGVHRRSDPCAARGRDGAPVADGHALGRDLPPRPTTRWVERASVEHFVSTARVTE
jgi:hypothetical protein